MMEKVNTITVLKVSSYQIWLFDKIYVLKLKTGDLGPLINGRTYVFPSGRRRNPLNEVII